MASSEEIHFEIFCQRNAKSGWNLHEVAQKREDAIKIATALVARQHMFGARVAKQTYDAKTSDFLSLIIFETGQVSLKLDTKAEDVPPSRPCETPHDFYSDEARRVIARLLGDYLARQRLTPIELIHRGDALRAFESTQSVFQHAVQRLAVVRSATCELGVHTIIKDLNALITESMHRVYHDEERGYFPDAKAGEFGSLADRLAGTEDGAYLFHAALARHLKSAGSWDSKLARLLAVLDEAPQAGPGRDLLWDSVDMIAEEILNGSVSLYELIGGRENLNVTLTMLTDLFFGMEKVVQESEPGLSALAKQFGTNTLRRARLAVVNRIIAELKTTKRLAPAAVTDEIRSLTRLAARLAKANRKYLAPEDLVAVLTLRSRSVVSDKALNEIIANAATPAEKLERLLQQQDNIVGAENKRQFAAFMLSLVSTGTFESFFLAARPTPAAVLRQLAGFQARILESGLARQAREDIASVLDRLAVQVEARTGFFKSIEGKSSDSVDKALFFLNLCQGGVTEGRLSECARKAVQTHIDQPNFMDGFAAKLARMPGGNAKDPAAELASLLERAGIQTPSRQPNAA